jgi:Tfp pilus assembly PilM family ATPase
MPKYLALEWDTYEARLVVARSAGKSVEVEQAFAVPLADGGEPNNDDLGQRRAAACSERGVKHCQALIAVPRGKTELRVLQVPPAPDEELPDLVRFQALRQFTSLGDDWPLDFVRLQSPDAQQIRVLAATVPPQVITDLQQICTALEAPPAHFVLRSFASVSFYHRCAPDARCRLLVELFSDEVDLTVAAAGQVVLLRSVRLPSEARATALVGEIRRTLAAVRNQLADQVVDAVTLVGSDAELGDLPATLREQLGLEVTSFDPCSAAGLTPAMRASLPAGGGRFGALLGMVHDAAENLPHGIDFLNPRRRPKPPDRRRRYVWVAAAAASLLILIVGGLVWQIQQGSSRIKALQESSKAMDPDLKEVQEMQADVQVIDTFVAGNVNWLDQLHDLSNEFPPPSDAMVDVATFQSLSGGGGEMFLDGYVRDPGVIEQLESKLRREGRRVSGSGTQFEERQPELRWGFKERIVILPVDRAAEASRAEPVSKPSPKPPPKPAPPDGKLADNRQEVQP